MQAVPARRLLFEVIFRNRERIIDAIETELPIGIGGALGTSAIVLTVCVDLEFSRDSGTPDVNIFDTQRVCENAESGGPLLRAH